MHVIYIYLYYNLGLLNLIIPTINFEIAITSNHTITHQWRMYCMIHYKNTDQVPQKSDAKKQSKT